MERKGVLFNGFVKILEVDKELRIDNQYYLNNKSVDIDYDLLTGIFLKTKEVLNNLNSNVIEGIRKLI